jgi:molybdopterin-guanine dinucleotide biosynthesis protein A
MAGEQGKLGKPRGRSRHAGFVLAGGRSSRMGLDKALLEVEGATLIERIAGQVRRAAGSATIIGPAERYSHLGFPVVADLVEGLGPLGGLYTALSATRADWNLIVACDLPEVSAELLADLLEAAERCGRRALVPSSRAGLEPLCAVYHRSLLREVVRAINHKALKMQDFVSEIGAAMWPAPEGAWFRNVNTPADWGVGR